LVVGVLFFLVKRQLVLLFLLELLIVVRKGRIFAVFLERAGGEDLPPFHVEMILRAGERVVVAGFLNSAGWRSCRPKGIGMAHGIGTEALVRAGVAGSFAAVPVRQYDPPIGLAGQDSRACRHLASGKRDVPEVRKSCAV